MCCGDVTTIGVDSVQQACLLQGFASGGDVVRGREVGLSTLDHLAGVSRQAVGELGPRRVGAIDGAAGEQVHAGHVATRVVAPHHQDFEAVAAVSERDNGGGWLDRNCHGQCIVADPSSHTKAEPPWVCRAGGAGRAWRAGNLKAMPRKRVSPDAIGTSVKVPAWRGQFLPKSILGITALVLAFAVGAASSGAVLYAYYENRTTKNERRITDLVAGFDTRYRLAMGAIEGATAQAQTDLAATTGPLAAVVRAPDARKAMIEKTSPSVWFVSTLDEAGLAVAGSAFVVASDSQQSYLITSYSVIRAATYSPAPPVYIRKEAGSEVRARVWAWQPERDLAVLVVDRPNLPRLEWDVEASKSMRAGDRLFAVSGLGASGGSVDDALVVDVSAGGIQHSAPLGASFVGGPLVTLDGKVVGVLSRSYSPLGYPPLGNFFSPPISSVCERLLSCNNDTATGLAGEANAAGSGSGSGSNSGSQQTSTEG